MLKFTATAFFVFSILFVSLTAPASAQQAKTDEQKLSQTDARPDPAPDLKLVFDQETQEFKAQSAVFDPVKIERQNSQQKAKKKGWSTSDKLLLTAAIVGLAALLFVVIKYGKDCLRTDPANCTLGTDEVCTCVEYERRIPQSQ